MKKGMTGGALVIEGHFEQKLRRRNKKKIK